MTTAMLTTSLASDRGERLYPPTSSRVYYTLTNLRREMERVVADFILGDSATRVLDYGCGNMPYRPLMENRTASYVGCDLPGNEQADYYLSDNGEIPLPAATTDVVLSNQVLEHVGDPARYLAEANRVLASNGLLILSTHGVWRYHPDPSDFWRWTSAGLRRQIEAAQFDILHFKGLMGPAATALQLWQDAVLHRWPTRLRPVFTWCMQRMIESSDRHCTDDVRNDDASAYLLVARKVHSTE